MLLEDLARHNKVEEAAKEFAGNWQHWQSFVWFGRNDVPNSQNVALGYLVNHQHTVEQVANLKALKHFLKDKWGDMTKGAEIGDYGADFCGDKNLLTGLMVRVYNDEGQVTKVFQQLFALAHKVRRDGYIDKKIYDETNREMLRNYVAVELDNNLLGFDAYVDAVTDTLLTEETDLCADHVGPEEVEKCFKEIKASVKKSLKAKK